MAKDAPTLLALVFNKPAGKWAVCFAYALAKEEACDLLSLDRDFRNTDLSVVIPPKA